MDAMPILYGYEVKDELRGLCASGATAAVIAVPWEMIAPHERQAKANHGGQTLKRLAERGGLGLAEAVAVLEDRPFKRMALADANAALLAIMRQRMERQP